MYTLIISVAVSTALSLGLYFLTYSIFWPLVLMVVGILGLNFFIGKKMLNKLTALFGAVEKDIQANRVEKAVEKLKSGYDYAKWQFMVKEQIDSQIGIIYYTNKQFEKKAAPYLENAFSKKTGWLWQCMPLRHIKQATWARSERSWIRVSRELRKRLSCIVFMLGFCLRKGIKRRLLKCLPRV